MSDRKTHLFALLLALVCVAGIGFGPETSAAPTRPTKIKVNLATVAATLNTDILGTDISVDTAFPSSVYEISVAIEAASTDAVFSITEDDGASTRVYGFNSGTALTNGDAFTFTWGAVTGITYNFQFSATTNAKVLVQERQE